MAGACMFPFRVLRYALVGSILAGSLGLSVDMYLHRVANSFPFEDFRAFGLGIDSLEFTIFGVIWGSAQGAYLAWTTLALETSPMTTNQRQMRKYSVSAGMVAFFLVCAFPVLSVQTVSLGPGGGLKIYFLQVMILGFSALGFVLVRHLWLKFFYLAPIVGSLLAITYSRYFPWLRL